MANKSSSPWFTDVHEVQGQRTTTPTVQCNLCHKVMSKRLERQLSHLGYEGKRGVRLNTVTLCPKLNTRVMDLFRRCDGRFPPDNGEMSCAHSIPLSSEVPNVGTPRSTGGDSCVGSSQATPSIPSTPLVGSISAVPNFAGQVRVGGHINRAMKQSVIEDGFAEADRRDLDILWAKFFYEANVPFAVARNPIFQEAVMKTASFRKPYVPPSYHDIRTKLLGQVKRDLEGKLDSRLKESLRKFGGTLAMDGWSSVSSRPLVNAMLVTPAGELFLGAVDTTGKEKTAMYMASIMVKFIKQVGPENVVQVCTDNASVMINASRLVVEDYPHIFIQGCATHAMDLLLEDWGKASWVKETLEKAKGLVKFIKNRQMPLAVFRKHETRFSLLMPGKTRFACNFIMIDRLLQVRDSLEQTVVDPQWLSYASKKSLSARDKLLESRNVRKVVLDDGFWKRCTNFRDMVAPVVYALREFDGKEPCTGKALHIVRQLEKHVLTLSTEPFSLPTDLADIAKENFYARKKMMTTDLLCAGALLNPYLLHDKELADDTEVWHGCRRVLKTLCAPGTYHDVANEYMAFRMRSAPFHEMLDPTESKCSPFVWWEIEGFVGKLLAPIAKRILAQTVSSSACERNWSSYSFVHDRKRNRLLPERADDLVFVYTNSKLLANAKLTDEKRWYSENLDVEDRDVRDSEDEETPHNSIGEGFSDHVLEDLEDDLNSIPAMSLQDALNVPNTTYDFVDDDAEADDPDELLRLAHLPEFQKDTDKVTCDNTPRTGLTRNTNENVVLNVKIVGDDTHGRTVTFDPITRNMTSATTDEPALPAVASRSQFQKCDLEVPTVMEKSSKGLVSLSNQVRPRTVRTNSGGISSDSDVPLLQLGYKNLPGGSRLRKKEPPRVMTKRKAPMLPFLHDKPKNPLDAIENAGKFKIIHLGSHKRRIKQEVSSDFEDDPTGSSGAEVKGDSDYTIPTDVDE